jgi:hypothetical protein
MNNNCTYWELLQQPTTSCHSIIIASDLGHSIIHGNGDELATDHLRRQTQRSIKVPVLPASIVMLELQQRTITRALPTQIRHICGSSLPYTNDQSQRQHLCQIHDWIHDWTYSQFHQIDWEIFDSITNKKASFPN